MAGCILGWQSWVSYRFKMKKDIALIGGLFLVVVLLLVFGKGFTSTGAVFTKKSTSSTAPVAIAKSLKIKGLAVNIDIADTADEQKKGLSGRNSMKIDQGLLFVFEKSGVYAIWMKDMKFAIDIVWISADKKVVDIAQNVAPEPGKKDRDLAVYTPKAGAKYVLEVNAGLTSLNNILIGDSVEF